MPDPVTGRVGYCTNVHAGTSLEQVLEGLATHAVAVRRALGWDELGLGLWLSNEAAEELAEREDRLALRDALANLGLF
ncbi:MAG: metabolite traffic protein EboE, partial [Planctomycetota bacterium]